MRAVVVVVVFSGASTSVGRGRLERPRIRKAPLECVACVARERCVVLVLVSGERAGLARARDLSRESSVQVCFERGLGEPQLWPILRASSLSSKFSLGCRYLGCFLGLDLGLKKTGQTDRCLGFLTPSSPIIWSRYRDRSNASLTQRHAAVSSARWIVPLCCAQTPCSSHSQNPNV